LSTFIIERTDKFQLEVNENNDVVFFSVQVHGLQVKKGWCEETAVLRKVI